MAGGGGRKGDNAASAGGKRAKANGGALPKDKEDSGPLPSLPERPKRSATTEEARLAHMLGDDAGEVAKWLTKNCKNPAALAKAKAAIAAAAGQPDSANANGKRNRPQMQNLIAEDSSEEEDELNVDAGGTEAASRRARREPSVEHSGSEYKEGEDGEEETDSEGDNDLEEEDAAKELGTEEAEDTEKSKATFKL
jgi:hypothetical protein